MDQKSLKIVHRTSSQNKICILSLTWLASIILGGVLSFILKKYAAPLVAMASHYGVSVAGLCVIHLAPFLSLLISNKLSNLLPVYLLIGGKGICLGYAISAILWSYGTAAWLLHFLLSFSSIMTLIPILDFFIQHINAECNMSPRHTRMLLISALVGLIDYFIISPGVLTL